MCVVCTISVNGIAPSKTILIYSCYEYTNDHIKAAQECIIAVALEKGVTTDERAMEDVICSKCNWRDF